MTRVFKANSSLPTNNYRPKNVDINRKANDSNCSVDLTFSCDLEMGENNNVVSVDAMSLLAGSDTFNSFAKVFDQFKINSYHLCVDLSTPASFNASACPLFSFDDTVGYQAPNGTWFGNCYQVNNVNNPYTTTKGNVVRFYQKLEECLQYCGIMDQNDNFNVALTNIDEELSFMYTIYAYWKFHNVALRRNVCTNINLNYQPSTFNQNISVQFFEPVGNAMWNSINSFDVENSLYQVVGASALRQVPKGFYNNFVNGAARIDLGANPGYRMTIPNMYSIEAQQSVGNYIWQSYMPGSALHLSLDMKATSATEKSLYYPTALVHDISSLDSMNQQGRFTPIGYLSVDRHTQAGDRNSRRQYVNNYIGMDSRIAVYNDTIIRNNPANNPLVNGCCSLTYSLPHLDGNTYIFHIFFAPVPIINGMNDNPLPVSREDNFVIGDQSFIINPNDQNPYDFDNVDIVSIGDICWEHVPFSNVIYYLYIDDDVDETKLSVGLNVQAYINCRFKTIRNLTVSKIYNYPYGIFTIKFDQSNPFIRLVDPLNANHYGNGITKTLVSINTGFYENFAQFNNSGIVYGNKYPEDITNGGITYSIYHNIQSITNAGVPMQLFYDENGQNIANRFLYGIMIVKMPTKPKPYVFLCNALSFSSVARSTYLNLFRVNGVDPANQVINGFVETIFVASTIPIRDGNSVGLTAINNQGLYTWPLPTVANWKFEDTNNVPVIADWEGIEWRLDISRLRSVAVIDKSVSNAILENDLSVYANFGKANRFSNASDPIFGCTLIDGGYNVGTIYPNISNLI